MYRYVARVWLPDRPGALGQVASRIGAVRGDVVGIEILERGAGRAIDELIVELPEDGLVDLLVAEMAQVDGVDVEEIRPLTGEPHEPELDALAAATRVVAAPAADRLAALAGEVDALFGADWVVVLGSAVDGQPLVSRGAPPDHGWLAAFARGARHLPDNHDFAPHDVAVAAFADGERMLAVGRSHRPLRWRERRTIALLVTLAELPERSTADRPQRGDSQPRERSTARAQSL